jgi:hypothetical protein
MRRRSVAENLIVDAVSEDRWLTAHEISKICGLSSQKVGLTISFKCKDLIARKRMLVENCHGKNKQRVMFVYKKRPVL